MEEEVCCLVHTSNMILPIIQGAQDIAQSVVAFFYVLSAKRLQMVARKQTYLTFSNFLFRMLLPIAMSQHKLRTISS